MAAPTPIPATHKTKNPTKFLTKLVCQDGALEPLLKSFFILQTKWFTKITTYEGKNDQGTQHTN